MTSDRTRARPVGWSPWTAALAVALNGIDCTTPPDPATPSAGPSSQASPQTAAQATSPAGSDAPSALAASATPGHGPAPAALTGPDPSAPADSPEPVSIALDRPYKLGALPEPKDSEGYRVDISWRRAWNTGGLGTTLGEPVPPEGHPDPRVVIEVLSAEGPLSEGEVQRIARKYHWIHVVRCHALASYRDPLLHGLTRARFTIGAAGTVRKPRLESSDVGDREVAECIVARLEKLEFPKKRRATRVELSIKVWPGDDPTPPPEEILEPGPGTLGDDAMLAGVRAGLPAVEACYRAAFAYAPALWGRLIVRFHVTADGRTTEAFEGGSRFPDARVKQCILRTALGFRFERPQGGDLRFAVPLRLSTERAELPPQAEGVGPSARLAEP